MSFQSKKKRNAKGNVLKEPAIISWPKRGLVVWPSSLTVAPCSTFIAVAHIAVEATAMCASYEVH